MRFGEHAQPPGLVHVCASILLTVPILMSPQLQVWTGAKLYTALRDLPGKALTEVGAPYFCAQRICVQRSYCAQNNKKGGLMFALEDDCSCPYPYCSTCSTCNLGALSEKKKSYRALTEFREA